MTVVGKDTKKEPQVTKTVDTSPEAPDNVFDSMEEASPIPPAEDNQDVIKSSKLPGVLSSSSENKGVINHEKYEEDELVITSAEKTAFVNSMITGERYKQNYSIFGGKINIVIRSRTSKETQAMYAYIRHEMSGDGSNLTMLEGDMQYILLVAQVEEVNGTKFTEMKVPLTYVESEGDNEEPGWIADLMAWKSKPEGLVSAIINRIQLFEYKYWTMVKEASNKNFWSSDTSTAA